MEIARWRPAGAQPTIVMLHEGLGSLALWKDVPQAVAERTGSTVVAYSRYGHGASEPLAAAQDVDYMHREAQRTLPALLEDLGIERPVLLGHSDGASIAVIFAGTYPDAASGLILEAPHVFVEDCSIESIAKAKAAFATTDLERRLARYHTDPARTFRGWNDIWLDPRFRAWNIEEFLGRVRVPVLVIQGTGDEYGTAAQPAAIAAATGARVLLLERCGHSPHRDRPGVTLRTIEAFVAEIRKMGAA